jgi:hypothetical protein
MFMRDSELRHMLTYLSDDVLPILHGRILVHRVSLNLDQFRCHQNRHTETEALLPYDA